MGYNYGGAAVPAPFGMGFGGGDICKPLLFVNSSFQQKKSNEEFQTKMNLQTKLNKEKFRQKKNISSFEIAFYQTKFAVHA